jgi:hypothetical protein
MYDMSFILCVSDFTCSITTMQIENYSTRLDKFKECGLMNIGDKKVKVFLLVGNEEMPTVEEGWQCDTEVVRCDFWHNAPKTNHFFAEMTKSQINSSRWFMKIDDDSTTNVSALIDKIDEDFSWHNNVNITSEECNLRVMEGVSRPQDDMYISLIRESDYAAIIEDRDKNWKLHEWEHNILSGSAVKHILNKGINTGILLKSLKYGNSGRSDHLITLLSNLSDIPFEKVKYMAYLPYIGDFISGKMLHIHYLYDKNRGGSPLSFRLLQINKGKIPFKVEDNVV